MQASWLNFDWVEVQGFSTGIRAETAILFCPGFPGAAAGAFERKHAAGFVQAGYDLYVIHHKGTKIRSEFADASINNQERYRSGLESNEICLGGGPSSIEEWLTEPNIALKALQGKYTNIIVLGNSFGALASLWSLTQKEAPIKNVSQLILVAGAQGVYEGKSDGMMKVWKDLVTRPHIIQQIDVGDPVQNLNVLERVYQELPNRVSQLPELSSFIYVYVEGDELFSLEDTLRFRKAIGERGRVVIDSHNVTVAKGKTAHTMPNTPTSFFLDLIRS